MYTAAITNSVHLLSEAMVPGNWIWVIPELSKRIILMSRQGDLLYDRNYISVTIQLVIPNFITLLMTSLYKAL